MISRYGIFCKVLELKNFTRVAKQLGYSQSAVSQSIKTLEQELGAVLFSRRKDGIGLTDDGREYFPYIQAVYQAEKELETKIQEMKGLGNSVIRIGTFTSVSRNILPLLMKTFKECYPGVTFVLRQGEYTSIEQWIREGSIDFGFVDQGAVPGLETKILYVDQMKVVLPLTHVLADKKSLSWEELADEPIILLDEGEHNVAVNAFHSHGLSPKISYEVYDDYTILAMVRQGLGLSLMYERVLVGFEEGLKILSIEEPPKRTVALAWKNKKTMSHAASQFADYIIENSRASVL